MASQPSKSLRNDLGRATLTVLPVGYSQNGYSKKRILRHYTGRLQEYPIFPEFWEITRMSKQ